MMRAVVVGGGLVGLAAAVVVARSGAETTHLAPKGPPDRRTSALMMPSVEFLESSGLIDALGAPLTAIRIIDATGRLVRAPETLFAASEAGIPAFGWNFPNAGLSAAFSAVAARLPTLATRETSLVAMRRTGSGWQLTLGDGSTLDADLVVGADGKRSAVRTAAGIAVRETEFKEAALVCDLSLGRSLGGTSVEFHYPHGPFTLVPAGGDRANLVWIDDRATLDALKASGPEELRTALLRQSQRLFGDIEVLTPAVVFPLSTLSVATAGRDGVVLVGEAAHAFPPIGAQGLNLGLRDVADLAESLAGSEDVSTGYAGRRATDLARTGGMVDALFRSLLIDMLPAQALRAGGLWALKTVPGLRRQAFSVGMGIR